MRRDPAKRDTGLFFFRGRTGAPVAVVSAGGGFAYVGAMQDSFPHALVLSERGVNAFALIYRPRAQTACEDLSRAVAFLHEYAAELGVDMRGYSLWGGSAGARMAAWVGSHGTEAFGQRSYPRPAAVIMQYTGRPMALPHGRRCSGVHRRSAETDRRQRSKCLKVCRMASGLVRALLPKDG